MGIAEIFTLGYGGGWDDDYDCCGHGHHWDSYDDDDDDGLLGIDIDL